MFGNVITGCKTTHVPAFRHNACFKLQCTSKMKKMITKNQYLYMNKVMDIRKLINRINRKLNKQT